MKAFKEKIRDLFDDYEKLVTRKNIPVEGGNGIFTRYQYPVLTAAHTPVFWRYDLDEKTNLDGTYRHECYVKFGSYQMEW